MEMNADIAEMISKCITCTDFRNSMTDGPWQLVGSDLFTLNNEDYVVIVDYNSKFFKPANLEDTRIKTVIMHMKLAFARHGIPYEVRSDNGSYYTSRDFKDFARKWSVKHTF